MQTVEEILDYIKRKDTNIKKLSTETGIPYDRLYSWRKNRGTPKAEDTAKLLKWAVEKDGNSNEVEEIQTGQIEKITENIESANKDIASNSEMTGMFLVLIEHLQKIEASLSSAKGIVQQNNSLIQTVLLRMAQEKEHSPQGVVKIFDGSLKVAEEFLKSNFERTEKDRYDSVGS